MDEGRYRSILPASRPPPDPSLSATKRRRRNTKVACNACRVKKRACDGVRPVCSACQTTGSECMYLSKDGSETRGMVVRRELDSMRSKVVAAENFVDVLRFSSEDVAVDLVKRLRRASDPGSILQIETFSEEKAGKGILSLLSSQQEFELHVRHPTIYPLSEPKDDKALVKSEVDLSERLKTSHSAESPASSATYIPTGLPYHYETQQLKRLNITFWTTIVIPNELAAGAISSYLETNHQFLGLFDARLFVDDLVSCRLKFCSHFLVNSLLAFALQAYGSTAAEAFEKSYEFEAEADSHWRLDVQRSPDSIMTIAGLALMYQSTACHGRFDVGMTYIEAMIQMAHRLKLFGGQHPVTADDLGHLSREEQWAFAHAAWGAFNMTVSLAHFHLLPTIERPPSIPVPGDSDSVHPPYVGGQKHLPPTFLSFCKFWAIMSEILLAYRYVTTPADISVVYALTMYGKLLQLSENISDPMFYDTSSHGDVLVFHIWFHAACLDLLRPFLLHDNRHSSGSWSPSVTPIRAIFAASLKQLKRLILEFISRNDWVTQHLFWHIALIYIANAALKYHDDPESRSDFLLCIRGYQRLYAVYDFVKATIEGLLAMAIQKGLLSTEEARVYVDELQAYGGGRKRTEQLSGGYVLDLNLALTDSEAAKVDKLRDDLEGTLVFEEFTNEVS